VVGFPSRFLPPTWRSSASLLFVLLLSQALASSALAISTLIVQVRTDLDPGTELGWVRAQFLERDGTGVAQPELAAVDRWMHYSDATNWGVGVRVAEVGGLVDGLYRGSVSIYDVDGGLIASRPVRVTLTGGTHVVTVLLVRDPMVVTPPQPGFLPGTETSHWTSEEGPDQAWDTNESHLKDPVQCPVNLAMTGLGCNGSYCDNVRVHCRAAPVLLSQVHRWTAPFSEESASFEGCNSNEFATGLKCSGGYCDNISLRCTEHNATPGSCYVTDPISEDLPLTDYEDSSNGFVRRILCQGSNCDDKRLEICSIVEWPLNLGAFSDLCVTSVGGFMKVAQCESAENGANAAQVWTLDELSGQLVNPISGTCLTAIGGMGAVTEESCAEAGDTSWFMDVKGRLSSIDTNNDPWCLSVVGVQDPNEAPPVGAAFELGTCTDALYQIFEASNVALPAPLQEYDAGEGSVFPLPALLVPGSLLLIAGISAVGASVIRRR